MIFLSFFKIPLPNFITSVTVFLLVDYSSFLLKFINTIQDYMDLDENNIQQFHNSDDHIEIIKKKLIH